MTDDSPRERGLVPGLLAVLISHFAAGIGLYAHVEAALWLSHLPYLLGVVVLARIEGPRQPMWAILWVVVAVIGAAEPVFVEVTGHKTDFAGAPMNALNAIPAWSIIAGVARRTGTPRTASLLGALRLAVGMLIGGTAVLMATQAEPEAVQRYGSWSGPAWMLTFAVAEVAQVALVWHLVRVPWAPSPS